MAKISQVRARYYKNRTDELEKVLRDQKNRWSSGWQAGWVNIETINLCDASFAKIETARKLGHAVIAVPDTANTNKILFYADRLK